MCAGGGHASFLDLIHLENEEIQFVFRLRRDFPRLNGFGREEEVMRVSYKKCEGIS